MDDAKGGVQGDSCVGGLVGYNRAGTVSQSYATGAVTGTSAVGGLVGFNTGVITQSYAIGTVTGNTVVGALIGHTFDTNEVSAIVSQSYAMGMVTGNSYVGGLVGTNDGSGYFWDSSISNFVGYTTTVSQSYYDKETTRQTDAGNGEGKSTVDMKSQATYVNWDFGTIWEIREGVNEGYPTLWWENKNHLRHATIALTKIYDGSSQPPIAIVTIGESQFSNENYDVVCESDCINVGTHTVTISGKGELAGKLTKSFEITQAPAKDALLFTLPSNLTYNAQEYAATVSVKTDVVGFGALGNIYYAGADGTKYETSTVPPTNTGTYLVSFDATEATTDPKNYASATNELIGSFTIAKAAPTATELAYDLPTEVVYNKEAQPLPVMPQTAIDGLGEFTIKYNGSTDAPIGAGDYTVSVSFAEGVNYSATTEDVELGTYTISRATVAVPTVATGLVYNGTAQTGVVLATHAGYSSTGTAKATNAGNYPVTLTLDGNHKWADGTTASKTLSWSIAKKALSITAEDKTRAYGASNPEWTFDYSGFVNGETASVLTTKPSASSTATTTSSVGTYTITPKGALSSNYSIGYENGSLSITRAPVTVPTAATSLVYNGTAQTGVVQATNAGYSSTGTAKATNAGNYTVTLTLDGNHKWADESEGDAVSAKELSWSIGKATPTSSMLTYELTSATYNGSRRALSVAPQAGFEELGTITVKYGSSTTAPSAVGIYAITASIAASGNYKSANILLGDFEIEPATLSVKPDALEKLTDERDPRFTYTATGWRGTDGVSLFTGALSREAPNDNSVGDYEYTLGNLSAGTNYTLVLDNTNRFTINRMPTSDPIYPCQMANACVSSSSSMWSSSSSERSSSSSVHPSSSSYYSSSSRNSSSSLSSSSSDATPILVNPAESLNPVNPDSDIFDISGNRVHGTPTTPGIYIVRQGSQTKTIVVK
jgi:hypothetical protein